MSYTKEQKPDAYSVFSVGSLESVFAKACLFLGGTNSTQFVADLTTANSADEIAEVWRHLFKQSVQGDFAQAIAISRPIIPNAEFLVVTYIPGTVDNSVAFHQTFN